MADSGAQLQQEGRDGGFSTDVCDVVNCYRCRVVRVLALPEGGEVMGVLGFIAAAFWGLLVCAYLSRREDDAREQKERAIGKAKQRAYQNGEPWWVVDRIGDDQ